MNESSPTRTSPAQELDQAMSLLRSQLDPQWLNDLQPSASQAVFTTWITVWMLICQRLQPNASLAVAVGKFLESMADLSTNKRVREQTLSANTGGFSRARTRLQVDVVQRAADRVFESMLPRQPRLLKDRRVWVVDGTNLSLSANARLRQQWPPCPNQHGPGPWPICRLAVVHDLESGLALRPETGAMYGEQAESEVALVRRMLTRIPKKSVLMADRNFGVFDFVYYAVQAGHDVLTRLTEDRFRSLQRKAKPVRTGVWSLLWKPTPANRKSHPELPDDAEVSVYLHEFVGHSGQTLWVATTLDLGTDRVAACYARRTEIETDIRHWKKTLETDALRGQSPDMVLKELAIAAIAYNLVVQVRYLASVQGKIPAKKISFRGVWSLLVTMLLNRDDRTADEWQQQFELVLAKVLQRKLPNRPNRSYPRTAYTRSTKYPRKILPDWRK